MTDVQTDQLFVYLREGESGEGSKEGCLSSSLSSLCESVSRSPTLCYVPSHVDPPPTIAAAATKAILLPCG